MTQAGMASAVPPIVSDINSVHDPLCFGPIMNTLNSVFDVTMGYTTNIPSFGSDWGFVMAFNTKNPEEDPNEWRVPSAKSIDASLSAQLGDDSNSLKHYDGETHCRMFSLPKPLRMYLDAEKRIMTKDNPIYMYQG